MTKREKKRAIAGYLPLIRLIIKLLIKLNILLIEKKIQTRDLTE